ncbi:MAG: hypothetical protein EOP04_25580, partial [Proteobacteria bacterium]
MSVSANAAPRKPRSTLQTISKRIDFAGKPAVTFKSSNIDFFFSDIPADQRVNATEAPSNFYELVQGYQELNSSVSGQFIGYHNRSDDTDVNLQIAVGNKPSEKLKPNTTYTITAKINFITNVSSSLFGIGGSADSNSFGLAVSQNPWVAKVESADAPTEPSEPSPTDPNDPISSYYGIPPSFIIESSELADLALAAFDNLSADELALLSQNVNVLPSDKVKFKAAVVKVLNTLYTAVLDSLAQGVDTSDPLTAKIAKELDRNIKDKLNSLSKEDLANIIGSFGGDASPVVALARETEEPIGGASSEAHLRTSTIDSEGKVRTLGVPSGDCTTGEAVAADKQWICSHYSYMGRINNGLEGSESVWKANSVSTQAPVTFKTDSSGNPLYLNINSHSGFEGLTGYYLTGIEYK